MRKYVIAQCVMAAVLSSGGAFASEQSMAAMDSVLAMEKQANPQKNDKSSFYGHKSPPAEIEEHKETGAAGSSQKSEGGVTHHEDNDATGIPAATHDDEFGGQVAMPEITQRAVLSRSDVNRVVCRSPIRDVNYSDEKGVLVKLSGNNAFVKFQAEKIDGKIHYTKMPVELFISCGDAVYNLVAVPKAVPSQTIRLENGRAAKAKKNIALFKEQTIKKKVVSLIKRAYMDDLPESFTVSIENRPLRIFRDVGVVLKRIVTVDGEGLILKEYQVAPVIDGMELEERSFIRKEVSTNPIAVAFDRLKVARGEKARLFVVETRASMMEVSDVDTE